VASHGGQYTDDVAVLARTHLDALDNWIVCGERELDQVLGGTGR
jgi:hypothetical protein